MSRLTLAGVGWVPEPPASNRLLFYWPTEAAAGAGHLEPEVLVLERAPLKESRSAARLAGASGAPGPVGAIAPQMWVNRGDVPLIGLTPIVFPLGGAVQAVRFVYAGQSTMIVALADGAVTEVRSVSDGEWVWLSGAAIDTLILLTGSCTLGLLATADLYAPPPLPWHTIAEIDVAATGGASFADAATRYPAAPTMDATEWADLLGLWGQAWAEAPGAPGIDGGPNAWQALQLVLSARWEHSVLCGLGFADGSGRAAAALDRVDVPALLAGPEPVAYRVSDAAGRLKPSNVICIPGFDAPDPVAPDVPSISAGAVRIGVSGVIRASWDLAWHSHDPSTTGVEVRETVQASGSAPQPADYQARGHRPEDPPGSGTVHREVVVDSAIVTVAAQARSLDGFDRASTWSGSTGPQSLPIDHHPQAPGFQRATNDGITATLTQPPDAAPWAPDAIVAGTGGRVQILRRVASPRTLAISVSQVIKLPGGAFGLKTTDGAPPDPAAFVGGPVSIGAARGTVTAVSWPLVVVELPYAASGPVPSIVAPATATLTQAITDPALWQQITDRAAAGLPGVIAFPDPLPATGSAQLLDYRARVSFAGQLGPMGPAVQALRLPDTPVQPPPFTVTTLGVDFYQRTLVQLALTARRSDRLAVWWADGPVADADFARAATPGDVAPRRAEDDTILWDTLSLPIPRMVDRVVTIGVQGVNDADGRGPFSTVQYTLIKP